MIICLTRADNLAFTKSGKDIAQQRNIVSTSVFYDLSVQELISAAIFKQTSPIYKIEMEVLYAFKS